MIHVLAADRTAPQRWKNGGGSTRELLAWPAPADWQLRVSVADIEADGPFSAFPGILRHFAVLQGDGVELRFGDAPRRVTAHDPLLRFDGAAAPHCRLLGGATRDLNVMHRAELALQVTPADQPLPAAPWRALFTTAPTAWNGLELPALSLAWSDDDPAPWPAPSTARAWWIHLAAEPAR